MRKKYGNVFFYLLCLLPVQSFPQKEKDRITLQFHNQVGDRDLKLFDETYTNHFGEPFVIAIFRYYVSDITVFYADGRKMEFPADYFLIDESVPSSKMISLPGVRQGIASIEFLLGVDSVRNASTVQTGTLDPAKGMYWTWNSGYVFAKLEGTSDSSSAPLHSLSWHVGGYKGVNNALRRVKLSVSQPAIDRTGTIPIRADILQWFDAIIPVRISAQPICHQPGPLARSIADNYSRSFSIQP